MRALRGGFTLIEVLIAMAIFAVLSTMTFQALQGTLSIQERIDEHVQEFTEFQIVWTVLLRDLMNMARRPVSAEYGDTEAAFVMDRDGLCPLTFTRGGLQAGVTFTKTGMQRVSYCLEGVDELYRVVWPVLDRSGDTEPQKSLLMSGVLRFDVEADDPGSDCIDASPEESLPVGSIVVTIETESGEISRQFIGADIC